MKVLVTGGTNGMGKGLAKVLAGIDDQSHEIIILCRSKERGEATLNELSEATNNNKISVVLCDLTRISDVRAAIEEIRSRHESLDGIFINAGLGYAPERVETEDGMDPHFQVNYLSQFMLTLNLLDLLEKSENGGRVVFNVTEGGEIFWDDIQMKNKWSYEDAIHQGMVAKRMFAHRLHDLYQERGGPKVSFIGFQIHKTVWTNQINIIPFFMKSMARLMKMFGTFISMEECGRILAPLFTESQEESLKRSGKFITWKDNQFPEMNRDDYALDRANQEKLWNISLELCNDEETSQMAAILTNHIPGLDPFVLRAVGHLFPDANTQKYVLKAILEVAKERKNVGDLKTLLALLKYSGGDAEKFKNSAWQSHPHFWMDEIGHIFRTVEDARAWVKSLAEPQGQEVDTSNPT